MQDIQTQAIQTYEKNLEFFEKNFPSIYNKLLALERVLDEGSYPQKYELVYQDGYFDVVELSSGARLYNTDSQKFSQEIVDNISLKKRDQSFRSLRKINFEEFAFEKIKDANAYTNFATTAEIYELYHKNIDDTTDMIEIDKFIFLGVGLGFHIPKAMKKYDFQVLLIVEDNLELFRLSLFTVDYKDALKDTTLYFSIAEDRNTFRAIFNSFYTNAFVKNQFLKFHLFSTAYESKIREIQAILIGRPEATYSHNRLLEKNKKVIDKINEGYKFLDLRKQDGETLFEDKPWLVLGAGPSLYNNAEWIQEHQDRFVIIAAFTALNTLKRIGVTPDIAVQIDENVYTTHTMMQNLGDLEFLKETLIFLNASVSPELFEYFDKERIYLHEDRTKYKLSRSTLTVSSVGDSIYGLALLFNAPQIYLLGIDLALSDDGLSHSPDHFNVKTIDKSIKKEENQDFQLGDSILEIEGNFKEKVKSTPLFMLSIPVINNFTRKYKTDKQRVYNLSDGCRLEETIPTHTHEIKLPQKQNKKELRTEMQEYFDALSTTTLDQKEIDGIACRKGQLEDYYAMLDKFRDAPYSDALRFRLNCIDMVSAMCNHECPFELRELMTIYFINIAPYVDDFFNTKELKNPKKFTKKFRATLMKNIKKIMKTYEKDLNRVEIEEKVNSQA